MGEARRRQGRPKKGQEPVKPDQYPEIIEKRFQGASFRDLGEQYGCHHASIEATWHNKIVPWMRLNPPENGAPQFHYELEAVKKLALRRFHSDAPTERLEKIHEKVIGDKTSTEKQFEQRYKNGQVAWLNLWVDATRLQMQMAGLLVNEHRIELDNTLRIAGAEDPILAGELVQEIEQTLALMGPGDEAA